MLPALTRFPAGGAGGGDLQHTEVNFDLQGRLKKNTTDMLACS